MKKIIHTFALLLIVQAASFANGAPIAKGLNGNWFDEYSGQDIRIKQHSGNQLEVKDLFRSGWITYWNVGHGEFKDREGNLIRANSKNKIAVREKIRVRFSPDHYAAPIYFFKEKYRDHLPSQNRNSRYYRDNDRRSAYGNSNSCTTIERERDRTRNKSRFSKYNAIGEWTSVHSNGTILIRSTDRGIKVRRGNNSKWDYYKQERNTSHVFVNDRGNRYIFESARSLRFKGSNGKNMSFRKRY